MEKSIYWQYFSRCSSENEIIAIKYWLIIENMGYLAVDRLIMAK
jgi:hypothetical protein